LGERGERREEREYFLWRRVKISLEESEERREEREYICWNGIVISFLSFCFIIKIIIPSLSFPIKKRYSLSSLPSPLSS